MRTVQPLIIHPMDPVGVKIGGIETFIRNFVRHAPHDYDLEIIGVTSEPQVRPVGEWQRICMEGRECRFLPVLFVRDENVRTKLPLIVRFVLMLFQLRGKLDLENRVLEFHRIEPMVAFRHCTNAQFLFVHLNVLDLYSSHKDSKWSKAPWLYFQVEKRLIGKTTRIFSVQEEAVRFYSKKYPHLAERIVFTPNGVDETVFYPYSPEEKRKHKEDFLIKHGFDPQDDIILFVGRLDVQKDPMLLLDTFISLLNKRQHVKMVVVGTGTQEAALRKRTDMERLHRDVTFTGILPQGDVADLMRVSDVFLFTSAFEGMPMVVLEAQGCGLPVVSTDVGEVSRIVKSGSSGEIVTDRDPENLAGKILQVLENKARYSLANCSERLDSFRAADMLQRVYDDHTDT